MNEITPHHPRNKVVNVNCQKYLPIHFLHRFPLICWYLLITNMPIFLENDTYLVGPTDKQL